MILLPSAQVQRFDIDNAYLPRFDFIWSLSTTSSHGTHSDKNSKDEMTSCESVTIPETTVNWLDPWSPNHHWEKLLPKGERELLAKWRKRLAGYWNSMKVWLILLFYGIVEVSPGNYAFRGGFMTKYEMHFERYTRGFNFDKVSRSKEDRITRFVFLACRFFGKKLGFFSFKNVLPFEPANPFTSQPVEIQLMVLDQIPLYKADEIIWTCFPHLIPLWIKSVPRRVTKFMDDVCSRENMRYAGTQVTYLSTQGIIIDEIYRPRCIDSHPNFRLPGSYGKGHDFEWKVVDNLGETRWRLPFTVDNCPSLSSSKSNLLYFFEQLLLTLKREALWGKEPRFAWTTQGWTDNGGDLLEEWEKIGKRAQEYYHDRFAEGEHHSGKKCEACMEEAKDIPMFFPISSTDTNSSTDSDTADKIIPAHQDLLLFKDEVELILKNFQLLWRPYYFLSHFEGQPELLYDKNEPSQIITYAIDTVCFREVPLGEKLRCKHEEVPKEWLNDRGTVSLLLRNLT